MPLGDEVASATLSAGQKSIEITAELIKMLAPLLKKAGEKLLENILSTSEGKVAHTALVATAASTGSRLSSTNNILSSDVQSFVDKAKAYNIPVSVIGSGDKQTLEFLERDKGIMQQITQEIMQERLQGAPQSIKSFNVSENSVSAMKALFEQNGIDCQFCKTSDGQIKCVYPAEMEAQAEIIKEDYKQLHSEIADNCKININVPETPRQIEITNRIDELSNAEAGSEQRSEVYDNILSDLTEKGVELPRYSENNMQIIKNDMPYAKQAAGKAFWEKQGYTLNEDAKGIEIVAPQMDENGKPMFDGNGNQAFTNVTVYDISETNAYEKNIQKEISDLQNEYAAEKAEAFTKSDTKEFTLSDSASEKEITLTAENLTKEKALQTLREEFGYSEAKAELAANKICRDLGLDKEKFFADTRQYDNLNSLKTNIRYPSDDLTLRDVRFDAVNFKDGGTTHIVISNGDKTAALTPEKMTDSEMKNICVNQLEMSPQQAEKAIEKSKKINNQIMSKLEERTVDRDGISQTLNIKRTADNTFNVSMGDKSHTYNFSTIGVEENVARHFCIPIQNARNVVDKAKNQSVLQNKINDAAKKKKTANMPKPKLNESKGLKR